MLPVEQPPSPSSSTTHHLAKPSRGPLYCSVADAEAKVLDASDDNAKMENGSRVSEIVIGACELENGFLYLGLAYGS